MSSGRTLLLALAALTIIVLALGAAALVLLLHTSGPTVRARVARAGDDEMLVLEVPGAEPETRVRFGGTELPLVGNSASFPITSSALRVGENAIVVEVVEPGADTRQVSITLSVDFRIRADLGALGAEPPGIDVVVDAVLGSRVLLDGQPVPIDAHGHGARRYPVTVGPEAAADATVFEHLVRWRVEVPSATPATGELRTRVPVTTMQIERPGASVVTDQPAMEIAGMVDPAAIVHIDGVLIAAVEGRFVHRYPLPRPGSYAPRVVARAPGKVARVAPVAIRRVSDLALEAASYEVTTGLTYARISQNPAIYQGQRVALEGRVYNVEVSGGRSVLQMLVRDCPRSQRCPLWVTYPAATDVTANRWVRVLGTVAGLQQFRSESNRVIEVPRVDAAYILSIER